MTRSPWNLIANGSHRDVALRVSQSLQYGDRYQIVVRVGTSQLELMTREIDFLGAWLGMLSLELGRGIDQSSAVEGISSEQLRLARDLARQGFQIEYASPAFSKAIELSPRQAESLRLTLEEVLGQLGSM